MADQSGVDQEEELASFFLFCQQHSHQRLVEIVFLPPRASEERESTVEACLTEVLRLPHAISGQNGGSHKFRAACICYEYGLNDEEATKVMQAYNDQKCDPKWSAEEIKHKLADAYKRVQ
ncbi:hypothetical protein SH139x_003846 [Planctomycetaceae bacterium SH139]